MHNMEVYANTVLAIVGLSLLVVFIIKDKELDVRIRKYFLHFIIFTLVEALAHDIELYTATLEHLTVWRLILSAIGYAVRPAEVYILLRLNMRTSDRKIKRILFTIPLVVVSILAFSVFFTDVVYSYTESNEFVRGPLGFSFHFLFFLYLVLLISQAVRNGIRSHESSFESLLVLFVSIFIMCAILAESFLDLRGTGRLATTISIMAYYMYFQTAWYKNTLAQEKHQRVEVEKKSECDPLTGVLIKTIFRNKVTEIVESEPYDKSGALIFMDLDDFKSVNDRLGHTMGDQVLVDFAEELKKHFGHALIGRFGGDEFYVFLENVTMEGLDERASLLQTSLRKRYSTDRGEMTVTASMGVAHFRNNEGLTFDSLLKIADEATYQAKENGKNDYVMIEVN